MPVAVSIPAIFQPLTNGRKRLDVNGANVLEIIEDIERRHPGVKERLTTDGEVHRFVNIYVNDADIRFAGRLATPVRDGDCITILPAVAGGVGGPSSAAFSGRRG